MAHVFRSPRFACDGLPRVWALTTAPAPLVNAKLPLWRMLPLNAFQKKGQAAQAVYGCSDNLRTVLETGQAGTYVQQRKQKIKSSSNRRSRSASGRGQETGIEKGKAIDQRYGVPEYDSRTLSHRAFTGSQLTAVPRISACEYLARACGHSAGCHGHSAGPYNIMRTPDSTASACYSVEDASTVTFYNRSPSPSATLASAYIQRPGLATVSSQSVSAHQLSRPCVAQASGTHRPERVYKRHPSISV
jgi:hypothetical protein